VSNILPSDFFPILFFFDAWRGTWNMEGAGLKKHYPLLGLATAECLAEALHDDGRWDQYDWV
jgi:hypothetical protein